MRPSKLFTILKQYVMISIHAPLTGCDIIQDKKLIKIKEFQSTHPLRDATQPTSLPHDTLNLFQSTHPLRDATQPLLSLDRMSQISIHAPLTGCDSGMFGEVQNRIISIHAPLTGCDRDSNDLLKEINISIHAPLTGCDVLH